ncbi:MAG: RIP metalloprotease RseP [Candidatus Krumholzibacteria bacterium]|nr:RIP metalloprotease RseP [Candidatus Krumholzibacteria bacterium]
MLLTVAAFFFVLSIVVFVHELGHFVVGKLNGICVVAFSFGFGPKILRKKVGETEYSIGALPFGGYVKFAGETVEGESDAGKSPREPEVPPERMYRNKAPWRRMLVVLAGPVMNFILALFVYIFSLFFEGIYVNPSTAINEVEKGGPAEVAGLEVGDRILAIDGERLAYWGQIEKLLSKRKAEPSQYAILRGVDTLSISIAPRYDSEAHSWRIGIVSHLPARVGDVKKESPAERAGLRSGATILSINDTTVATYSDMEDRILPRPGVPMKFTWEIDGVVRSAVITPGSGEAASEGSRVDVVKVGQIGISPYYEKVRISLGEALVYGSRSFASLFAAIMDFLGKLFSGKATLRAIGGPIRVGIMAGDMIRWGFSYLVYFLAFFSLNLAIFNLLPILPFDGGHFVLGLIELVTRRRIGQKVQQVLTQVGFMILIVLMVFILAVDVFNIVR